MLDKGGFHYSIHSPGEVQLVSDGGELYTGLENSYLESIRYSELLLPLGVYSILPFTKHDPVSSDSGAISTEVC